MMVPIKKRARMKKKIKIKQVIQIGLRIITNQQTHQLLLKKRMKPSVVSAGIAITSLRTLSYQFANAVEESDLSITSASSTG